MHRRSWLAYLVVCAVVALTASGPAEAQLSKWKKKLKNKVDRKIDQNQCPK